MAMSAQKAKLAEAQASFWKYRAVGPSTGEAVVAHARSA
jgi:hypothetical protein